MDEKELEIVIYTITSLWLKDPNADGMKTKGVFSDENYRSRLVGFYRSLDKAKLCVEEDHPGFDECGHYNYIVIEGLWEGCYPGLGDNEWWYRHDYENRKWIPCERPKVLAQIVNFYG